MVHVSLGLREGSSRELKDILRLHSFWQWTHFSTIWVSWCYHLLIFLSIWMIFLKFYIFLITHKVGQLLICFLVKVAQSCLTPCDPMDIHGILQARILDWVAFPFSRGSSQPRDQTQVSHIAGRFFTSWATKEAQTPWNYMPNIQPSVHIQLPGERIIIFSKNVYDLQERLRTATHRSLMETII